MKKLLYLFPIILMAHSNVAVSADWWRQPTICRSNPNNCYTVMGTGFDAGMWDATGNCWGLKMICPVATTTGGTNPVAVGKNALVNGTGIKADFDTNVLMDNCFGVRKTIANGSKASVNGAFVNVWCTGVLNTPAEYLPTGEITLGTAPTCKTLSPGGFVAVLDQKCYGKYYSPADYYIECAGTNELPTKIVKLNGADKMVGIGSAPATGNPVDLNAAKAKFDTMQAVSAAKKATHF